MKSSIFKLIVICIVTIILGACSDTSNVDITEKFLIDTGYISELDLIEKQRKASWLIVDTTKEEREEIINLIDQSILETKSAFKNQIATLYSEEELAKVIKNKDSPNYKAIKNNLVEISKAQTEKLHKTLDNGLSDIRYKYGCCLQ